MAELKFRITGDSSSFKKALDDATRGVSNAKHQIEQEGKSMASVFDGLKNAAMGLGLAFGLNELKNLGNQIVKTRGQFQDLETSFKTMLGSASKGKALMDQLTQTAATTPFGLQDVAGGAKQLLAYGIEAEKVNEMLIRLGDIASGLSIPLNDLVYLYGTTMTQGRLFTQDLRQFQGRGIPIADELAKQFGIAKSQVGDFVTAGKVGAKEVEQAIINMTSEGSKFGGLMAEQSSNFSGKISNLEDQVDMLYNAIGKDMEGTIVDILDAAANAVDFLSKNYKELGFSIMGIISAYGAWKAGMLANKAIAEGNAINEKEAVDAVRQAYEEEISTLHELHAVQQEGQTKAVEVDTSDIDQAVSMGALSQDQADELIHLRELTAEKQMMAEAELANASALVEEKQALFEQASALAESAQAQEKFLQSKLEGLDEQISLAEEAGDVEEYVALMTEKEAVAEELATASTEANTAVEKANAVAKDLDAAKTQQQTAAKNLSTASSKANTAATLQNTNAQKAGTVATQSSTLADRIATASKNALTFATNKLKLAWQSLKGAFMSNPIGLILTAVTTAITLFMSWKSKQEELNKAVGEGVEKAKAFNEALQQENNAIENHVKTIRDANANKAEQVKAYNELMQLVPELTKEYTRQELAAMSATQAERLLTEALREREVAQMERGRATAQSTLQTLNSGTDDWKSLSPEQRKFLKEDFALDASTFEEDVDLVKQQLRGYIGELDVSIFKTKEFNKVLELTGMEEGATKTKKMTEALKGLTTNVEELKILDKLMKSSKDWTGINKKARDFADISFNIESDSQNWSKAYNDKFNELKVVYENNLSELKSIVAKYGIDFKTLGISTFKETDLSQMFEDKFAPILEAYKQNKTTLEQEIQADSGIKTEIELIAEMSEEELESELDAAYKEVKWIKERIDELSQDTFDEGTDVGYTFSIDAYPNVDNATDQINTSKDNLDNYTWQTFGRPLNVDTSANVNARVNLNIEKGIVNNPSGLSSSIFGVSDFFQALSGGGFTPQKTLLGNLSNFRQDKDAQIAFLTGQLEIANDRINVLTNRLEEKTKPKPTSSTPKSKSKKGTGKSTGSNRSTSKTGKTKQELEKEFKDAQEDLTQLQEEQAQELADIAKDRENTLTQLSIDLSAEGNAKYIKQMELNAKKQNEEYEKERREAIAKVRKMREDIHDANQEVIAAEKSKNAGKEVKYTKEKYDPNKDEEYKRLEAETNAYYNQLIADNNQKTDKEIYLTKMQSRWNYLKEYGSSYQKELSLVEEYEKKIADAKSKGDEWEAKRLAKEQKQKVSAMKFEDISMGIDWATLFNGVSNISSDMLKPMLEQLQAYTKTEEYSQAEAQTQQNIVNLIRELRGYLGSEMTTSFNDLATAITNFNNSVVVYQKAKSAEDAYAKTLAQAKADFDSGKITKEEFEKIQAQADALGDATASARESMTNFATTLNTTNDAIINSTSKLTSALNNAKGWKGLDGFSEVAQSSDAIDKWKGTLDTSLASMEDGLGRTLGTSLSKSIGTGLNSMGGTISKTLSSSLGSTLGFVAQIPQMILQFADAIKNFVKGILDSFSELLSFSWLEDLVNSILEAVSNLINTIFDLPENIYKVLESIIVKGVGGLLNSIVGRLGNILSLGALSSDATDWFNNSNAKEVKDTIDKLTDRNETLAKSIEHLAFEIEQARGALTIAEFDKAYKLQEEMNENYKEMAKAQASYHGAHHSWNYYWDGFTEEQLASIGSQIGENWNGDIWDLTPEQMAIVLSDPSIRDAIRNTGEGDYGKRVLEKLDEYADQANTLTDLTDKLNESLTGISFDTMYDSFVSSLMDMEYSAEDAAKNISEYFMKAMISNVIGEKYMERLKKWYETFADYMKSDGLDAKETQELTNDYLQMTNDAIAERDAIADLVGYNPESSSSSTSASGRGIETATQEQVSELNGRFTALQIAGEAIRTQSTMTNGLLQALTQQLTPSITASEGMNATLKELRELAWQRNNYLSDISDYSKNLVAIKKSLSQIESNTQNL